MSTNSGRIQAALFQLAGSLQDAHNNAVYSQADKKRLRDAFDKITNRKVLVQLNSAFVDTQPEAAVVAIEGQGTSASGKLDAAVLKLERQQAIDAAFAIFPMVDAVLPETATPFL